MPNLFNPKKIARLPKSIVTIFPLNNTWYVTLVTDKKIKLFANLRCAKEYIRGSGERDLVVRIARIYSEVSGLPWLESLGASLKAALEESIYCDRSERVKNAKEVP
jgi:hypothetical protein